MSTFYLPTSLLPPATHLGPGEAWELWQLELSGGGDWEKQLVKLVGELEEEVEGSHLGGVFTSVFGPIQVAPQKILTLRILIPSSPPYCNLWLNNALSACFAKPGKIGRIEKHAAVLPISFCPLRLE